MTGLTYVADVVSGVLLLAGSALALTAGLGLVRFDNLLARLHLAAKPQVLGLVLLLSGLGLRLRSPWALTTIAAVVAFQFLTAPIAAHMVGRAGYRTGAVRAGSLVVDELAESVQKQQPANGGTGRQGPIGGDKPAP